MKMRKKLILISILAVIMLLLSACSPKQDSGPTGSSGADGQTNNAGTTDNIGETPTGETPSGETPSNEAVPNEPKQRWSFDEFRQNEEDWMFFAPTTDDYMLTEAYWQVQEDSGLVYTMTILRSFDSSGAVVSQVMKYTFDIPPDAAYCYEVYSQDGTDYPSLVCVGHSVYVEEPADVVARQRTKAQFIDDYLAEGVKHWLSIP